MTPPSIPEQVTARATALGGRIRAARVSRKLRQMDLAERAGLSRTTIEAIERGALETGLGAYLRVLWVMGLDKEVDILADPGLDREGLALSYAVDTKRVRVARGLNNDF